VIVFARFGAAFLCVKEVDKKAKTTIKTVKNVF